VRFLQQRWCLETRWCCRASRRGAAAASAVLQRRVIGGPNPPCPYETSAAGLISGIPAALATCTSVYVRRGGTLPLFAPLYTGPYTVLELGEKIFRLQVGDREEAVSVDRLKPHMAAEPMQPAVPQKRGRPPGSAASSTTAAFG
jgi:hypothetical protein